MIAAPLPRATARGGRPRSRRRMPRGLRFTRHGKIYTAVTLGVGIAAVNTGNNLLFLMLGLMLGLILVSGILSEITLRGLSVQRGLPETAAAGTVFPAELRVANTKRFASSFAVELRDEIDGVPFRRRCFFLRVAPGEDRAIAYRCEIDRRGTARFGGTLISTRFPFGLFEKQRFIPLEAAVIVLPQNIPVPMPNGISVDGDHVSPDRRAGFGTEYRELREMVPGDDPRRIDWRATARLRSFMVRRHEVEADSFVEILLDASASENEDAEENIARAASIVRLCAARRVPVRLVTGADAIRECRSGTDCLPLLIHLALLDIEAAGRIPPPSFGHEGAVRIGPRIRRHPGGDSAHPVHPVRSVS